MTGSGTGPDHCHVWDLETGKEIVTYTKHDNIVIAAAVSPDGRLAATAGGNQAQIHIWNLETGETKQALAGQGRTASGPLAYQLMGGASRRGRHRFFALTMTEVP